MYYCCKGCDDCCRDCCKCCEDCCGEYCDAISECFSTPFSFCTLLSSFITVIPFILMIVAILQSSNIECYESIKLHLIIQGICNLLNFLFCVYLMCQYGKSYDDEKHGDRRKHDGPDEYDFMQRTVNLILYDFVVCFYIFFLIFFIIWTSIGFDWNDEEPDYSPCRLRNDGFLMLAHFINLYAMVGFLIIGFIVFIIVLMLYACDDGSCTSHDSKRCCILICTCGMCDVGKKKKHKYTNKQAENNRKQYKSSRKQWIESGKRNCGCLSLEKKKKKQHDPQQPYQQPQQKPPKQSKPKSKGLFSCFKKKNKKSKEQDYQQNPQNQHQQPPPPPPQYQPPPAQYQPPPPQYQPPPPQYQHPPPQYQPPPPQYQQGPLQNQQPPQYQQPPPQYQYPPQPSPQQPPQQHHGYYQKQGGGGWGH